MAEDSIWRTVDGNTRARALERRWQKLCALYLPYGSQDSIWSSHHASSKHLPTCGWKLHIPATILNAPRVLARIAPFLVAHDVQFKAARSLRDISALNSGLLHTYTQVGKIITVYPRDDAEAVYLAQRLHKLTRRFRSPSVPFDLRFSETSNVYYRYGAFTSIELETPDGQRTLAMPSPSGDLVPDKRENPRPDWVRDPFEDARSSKGRKRGTQVNSSFHVLRALVQRGKGGVYQALDLNPDSPRLCLLKEGRKYGEMTWDGRDGAWRVRHEERVLSSLRDRGIDVPKVYSRFELESNFYLVMEFVEGESLHNYLARQSRRLHIKQVLSLAIQLADFLLRMHQAGWAWRDCKPKNLILTRHGKLVPIDFEGASPVNNPDPMLWATPRFVPAGSFHQGVRTGATDDLFSLGSVLYLLITGRLLDQEQRLPIENVRRNVPWELRRLVESLVSDDPRKRPTARSAKSQLNAILRTLPMTRERLPLAKAA